VREKEERHRRRDRTSKRDQPLRNNDSLQS